MAEEKRGTCTGETEQEAVLTPSHFIMSVPFVKSYESGHYLRSIWRAKSLASVLRC
jgi:hypothetical protein